MSVPVSDRQRRGGASLAAAALLSTFSACGSPTAPEDPSCAMVPNPGIPLRSGIVRETPVDLQVGEACAVGVETGGSLRLVAAAGPAEYLVAIQSASRVAGASAQLSLTITGGDIAGTSVSGAAVPTSGSGSGAERDSGARWAAGAGWTSAAELRFRWNARRELARVRARPARPELPGLQARLSVAGAPPALGDRLVMRSSVDADLSVDCDRSELVPGVVLGVGAHFAIVEDVEAAGHLTAQQYAEIAAALDDPLYPVSEAYFGSPADLDQNERVLVFVTPIVNRATPRGSSTFIAGFFNPSDLSDVESCPASNSGEVLYVLAPDPDGVFGDPVSVDFAARNIAGVTAHEFTHLITAQQRVTLGGGTFADLEESWLEEGLAHTAEMVVGFAAAGLSPANNLLLDDLVADPITFSMFHLANFRRAGYYMLDPGRTLALGGVDGNDPGGAASLAMRGFSWMLLRWIADQADPGGGGILGGPREEALFLDLTSGGAGRARGIENVERVAGPAIGVAGWRELIARYGLAPLADDADGSPTDDTQVTSLHLPDIFGGLHEEFPDKEPFEEAYPLRPAAIELDGSRHSFTFELFSSASEYFVVRSGAEHGAVDLVLTAGTGGPIASTVQPQIVIQRTR